MLYVHLNIEYLIGAKLTVVGWLEGCEVGFDDGLAVVGLKLGTLVGECVGFCSKKVCRIFMRKLSRRSELKDDTTISHFRWT